MNTISSELEQPLDRAGTPHHFFSMCDGGLVLDLEPEELPVPMFGSFRGLEYLAGRWVKGVDLRHGFADVVEWKTTRGVWVQDATEERLGLGGDGEVVDYPVGIFEEVVVVVGDLGQGNAEGDVAGYHLEEDDTECPGVVAAVEVPASLDCVATRTIGVVLERLYDSIHVLVYLDGLR